jgi:hypothetical protein
MSLNLNLSSKLHFIHFKSKSVCDLFIKNLEKYNITILHICCSGTGIRIDSKFVKTVENLKKSFENNSLYIQNKENRGYCEICCIDDKLLVKCNQCKNSLCIECNYLIETKKCPYCRYNL